MKPYLIVTGSLFGLIALLHVWRAVAERHLLATNPGYFLGMAAIGAVAAPLSAWAWCLLRRPNRS